MYDKEIEDIIGKIDIFKKAYDNIRLIDPLMKKVIEIKSSTINNTSLQCFDFWGKDTACDNCVSIRAYRENETFVKLEYTPELIYMVTAIPVTISDRRVILELLKNISNSLLIDSCGKTDKTGLHTMIDSMNNMAFIDPLTGIYNRRFINERLKINIENAIHANYSVSIIMADIDFFKKVNDTYGHLTGDSTLQQFSEILTKSLKRESDWAARYGGEEFILCLPGAGLSYAVKIAEEIRNTIENTVLKCGEYEVNITASFGVYSLVPRSDTKAEDLIGEADKKLYEAKHNGRNRVEA